MKFDLKDASQTTITRVFDDQGTGLNHRHQKDFKDFVILWHGALIHYTKKVFQPKVAVLIRAIDMDTGDLGKFLRISSNVTDLSALSVGSVFRLSMAGSAVRHLQVDFAERKFEINFAKTGWDFYQIGSKDELGITQHYGIKDYTDDYFRDAWMVRFKLPNGWSLIVPCIELFSKTYGQSSVIKRNLMTYDIETFERKVFTKFPLPLDANGNRQINPTASIIKPDYQFLSGYQYELETTRRIVTRLVADRMAFFTGKTYFPQVSPWYEGPAELKLKHIVIKSTKTILGLDIIGQSYPASPPIVDLRPVQVSVRKELEGNPDPPKESGHRVYQQPALDVDLNQEEKPDKSLNVTTLKIGLMEHYDRATVIKSKVKKEVEETVPGTKTINEVDSVSNDFAEGSGKGVGKSNTYAEDAAKNPGTVLELWTTLLAIQKEQPNNIVAVHSYTFKKGYQCKAKPRLQALKATYLPVDKRGWFYVKERDMYRGMLIAKFTHKSGAELYWISIQRRTKIDGNYEVEIESFGGLVFKLKHGKKIKKVIKRLQKEFTENDARHLSSDFLNGLAKPLKYFKHSVTKNDPIKFRTLIEGHIRDYF